MNRPLLMTPGPTTVPERVALAMAQPMVHHRSGVFEALVAETRDGLKWIFGTADEVLSFASTETGAMEGVVANFLRRGARALVIEGGKFGERWAEICEVYGVEPVRYQVAWGEAADPARVAALLRETPGIEAVLVHATESSTGVAHPIQEIAAAVRAHPEVLMIVDGSSALGAADLPMDAWGIDVLLATSESLMLPPGLAFAAVGARAWSRSEDCDQPRYYFDWRRERDMQKRNQTAFTPALSLLNGLREVIQIFRTEGKERLFTRQRRMSQATRAAMGAMGLELFASRPAPGLTAVVSPVDSDALVKTLRERYGVILLGGQDQVRGKIFRVAHLGYFEEREVLGALGQIERALAEHGHPVTLGTGMSAALEVLAVRDSGS